MDDYTAIFSDLLSRNFPVIIYAGEFDERDGPLSIEPWLRNVD
jgi:hypothetical protein